MGMETGVEIGAVTTVTTDPGARERCRVDGLIPDWIATPASEAEVAATLQTAASLGLTVTPRGSGSKVDLGNVPERLDMVLALERLNQVVEYVPADLTMTVQAGMPLAAVQALAAQHGQMLPLDPPRGAQATMGGIVATATSGPRRMAYGSVRDLLLGTRVALADGRVIKTGGRVVKNVAGYDMNKLIAGSLGTLGVITEVTVRLRPRPEATATHRYGFADIETALAAAERVLNAELLPAALMLLTPSASVRLGAPGPVTLAVALEESATNVAYQAHRLADLVRREGDALAGETEAAFWEAIRNYSAPVTMQIHTMISELQAQLDPPTAPGLAVDGIACVGTGTVMLHARPDGAGVEAMAASLEDWFGSARATGGSAVLQRAPVAIKRLLDVWGPPRPEWKLMEGIKLAFDPARVLNRGRYVGGM
jgi:glycolate oxidase FAD binding subunit